jgi:hypothetical protein
MDYTTTLLILQGTDILAILYKRMTLAYKKLSLYGVNELNNSRLPSVLSYSAGCKK